MIMKTKLNKKEIQSSLKNAISDVLVLLNVESPSKKTKRAIKKASVSVAERLKRDLKKQFRLSTKTEKKNGKHVAKVEAKSKAIEIY